MAEPTPGRPGGGAAAGPTSATAATFVVNDKSLKDLHKTWQILIKDVKDFNKELQNLQRGAKTVDEIAAKLGSVHMGGGGGSGRAVSGTGGRMPGMPPVPVDLGKTIPVGNRTYQPPLAGEGGVPRSGPAMSAGTGGTSALAGGASPWKRVAEVGLAVASSAAMFYSRRMDDITDSDLFFNQQAQNTGYGYRRQEKAAVRDQMFGRPGGQGPQGGLTGYQSVQDALGGARAVFGATGGSWGGRGTAQLRAAGQLSVLNPDMGLAASGAAVGSLYDPTTSARAASMGIGPTVGMRGQLQSPQAIYQAILQRVYRGRKPTARMITEGLQPGANLYMTLTEGMGLTPDAIEQFARYAIAQANLGGNAKATDRAVALASKWASGGDLSKSEQQLVGRAGLTDNVRAARNAQGAAGARQTVEAGREAESTLESGFHALADVTDRLTDVFARMYKYSNGATGTLLGGAALGSGAVNSAFQAVGGIGGGIFAYQGVRQVLGRGGARAAVTAAGEATEAGAVGEGAAGAGAAAGGEGLMAAAGPVGIAIAAAFLAHIAGGALKSDAHRRGGFTGRAENVVGQHLSSSWKVMLNPGGYAKDMWNSVAHFADGGVVPGNHDRDDVDIKATPGEVVVPKPVVHLHGGAESLMRKLGFRGTGGDGHYAGGGEVTGDTKGLNPDFLKRLKAWSAAVGQPFNIGSGYRSMAEQKVLYDRWMRRVPGQAKAAKPGSSNHNYGLAADGPRWGDKHPEKFGLRYPMSFEPWHVEPANAKAMRGGAAISDAVDTSASDGVAPASTPAGGTYVTAPRVTAVDEKSAFAAWLAKADTSYGVNETPPATTQPPKAGGVDATNSVATTDTAPSDPTGNAKLGKQKAAARGWTGSEWDALYNLFQKESGWKSDAANASSSARGIAQTMMSVHFGKDWQKSKDALDFMRSPSRQIDWGLNYIAQRYTTPSKAWAHSQQFNWYDTGAWQTENETAVLHKDEMVVPAKTARQLRSLIGQQRNQSAMAQPSYAASGGGQRPISISLSMPIQLVGKATVDDAKHLVTMVRDAMQEDDELAKMGSG